MERIKKQKTKNKTKYELYVQFICSLSLLIQSFVAFVVEIVDKNKGNLWQNDLTPWQR